MTAAVDPRAFRVRYAGALADYLQEREESALHTAYELGRDAVHHRFSVLELALAHQEALVSALSEARDGDSVQSVTQAAGEFFLESLASFEMVQRGFSEAREALMLERRHARLSRQLSSFLADASLAAGDSNLLEEMLQLVAEHARDLVGAQGCLVTTAVSGQPRAAQASSHAAADRRWNALVRWLDLRAVYALLRTEGGALRFDHQQLADADWLGPEGSGRLPEAWLAAPLTTLDGEELGAIQLFDREDGPFTAEDEAVVVHLAQMASAAIERVRLYS